MQAKEEPCCLKVAEEISAIKTEMEKLKSEMARFYIIMSFFNKRIRTDEEQLKDLVEKMKRFFDDPKLNDSQTENKPSKGLTNHQMYDFDQTLNENPSLGSSQLHHSTADQGNKITAKATPINLMGSFSPEKKSALKEFLFTKGTTKIHPMKNEVNDEALKSKVLLAQMVEQEAKEQELAIPTDCRGTGEKSEEKLGLSFKGSSTSISGSSGSFGAKTTPMELGWTTTASSTSTSSIIGSDSQDPSSTLSSSAAPSLRNPFQGFLSVSSPSQTAGSVHGSQSTIKQSPFSFGPPSTVQPGGSVLGSQSTIKPTGFRLPPIIQPKGSVLGSQSTIKPTGFRLPPIFQPRGSVLGSQSTIKPTGFRFGSQSTVQPGGSVLGSQMTIKPTGSSSGTLALQTQSTLGSPTANSSTFNA